MKPENIVILSLLRKHGRREYEKGNTKDLREYAQEHGIEVYDNDSIR